MLRVDSLEPVVSVVADVLVAVISLTVVQTSSVVFPNLLMKHKW